uniref:thiazole biosynthesis protein ThiG n=1 Tax=Ascoseira mirabilis TaxID=76830 RepID=UPI0030039C69|nr:thiazole biosynthesis protein ThiG [Ascoseira mirabilis]
MLLISNQQDTLTIGQKIFGSRLILGTGRYRNIRDMLMALSCSDSDIVTVAIRRLNIVGLSRDDPLIKAINWERFWILPNTAGAKTIEEAIRLAFLGRELCKRIGQKENNFIKLEVISDPKYLFPDPIGTVKAAEFLVKKGFTVLPYTSSDPILAKHLEDIGCSTIMPLGSPIGSSGGIQSVHNIQIIIENSKIPVIIDAGIGTASEAAFAMELGAEAVLINTAIAESRNPVIIANAMKLAVQAGRQVYLDRREDLDNSRFAKSSSPLEGSNFLDYNVL